MQTKSPPKIPSFFSQTFPFPYHHLLQLLDFECFISQSITESIFVEFLQEIIKQHTSLSPIDLNPLHRQSNFNISINISINLGQLKKTCLTFDRSTPPWRAHQSYQSCFQEQVKEYHSRLVC